LIIRLLSLIAFSIDIWRFKNPVRDADIGWPFVGIEQPVMIIAIDTETKRFAE